MTHSMCLFLQLQRLPKWKLKQKTQSSHFLVPNHQGFSWIKLINNTDNIRIFGVREDENEDVYQKVIEVAHKGCPVTRWDIRVCH